VLVQGERTWSQPQRDGVLAVLASVALHLATYGALQLISRMPDVDFELQHPSAVEFGLSDPQAVAEPVLPPPVAAPEPAAAPASDPVAVPEKKPKKKKREADAGVDAGIADLPGDGGALVEAAPDAGAQPVDGLGQGEAALAQFAPEGAQIALRVHMGHVRQSELAEDVRLLLDAIPDWRLLLEGSELDPLRDLERIYLATPDLRRTHLVVAGEYVGSVAVPEQAVAKLAQARGVKARWRKHGTIRVAPWANADETARVLALIAPQQFAITRPEDLPRVLAVARALAARAQQTRGTDAGVSATDALLGLAQDQTLGVSVEGARLFVRGNARGVPERLDAAVRRREDGAYEVRVLGHFEDEDAAKKAHEYWTRQRDRFSGHPLVALVGLRQPLVLATLEPKGQELELLTTVTVEQARIVLGFLRDALTPVAPRPAPSPVLRPSSP
jgi:hypothetical protein